MINKDIPDICSCRFSTKAVGDFIDTFGRSPMSNNANDCAWIGKRLDAARSFDCGAIMQRVIGRDVIVNYWKCRRVGKIVPLGGNKVGMNPIVAP